MITDQKWMNFLYDLPRTIIFFVDIWVFLVSIFEAGKRREHFRRWVCPWIVLCTPHTFSDAPLCRYKLF